jgi:hypothetical protein
LDCLHEWRICLSKSSGLSLFAIDCQMTPEGSNDSLLVCLTEALQLAWPAMCVVSVICVASVTTGYTLCYILSILDSASVEMVLVAELDKISI